MMGSRVFILVTCFIYSVVVRGFEEEVEGYVAGQGITAKENVETKSLGLPQIPPLQLAASRQVNI